MIVFVYMLDWLMRLLKMTGAVELIALAAAVTLFHEEQVRYMECDVPPWIPVSHAKSDDCMIAKQKAAHGKDRQRLMVRVNDA